MHVFILVFFYSFPYKSFEIDVEDEWNHVSILELFKFENVFGFSFVVFDTYVSVDAEMLFESLEFLLLLLLLFLFLSFCLSNERTGEGYASRSVLNAVLFVSCKDGFGCETS